MRSGPTSYARDLCDSLRYQSFMSDVTQAPAIRRFGGFEINLQSGELRKNGMRLRLSGQPFQVLAVLTERPSDLVTREELHSKLWPADTFVDFDHGLNNAVARIREVLDDSSENPRYIETIPRRGYRFIAPVTDLRPGAAPATRESSTAPQGEAILVAPPLVPSRPRRFSSRAAVLLAGVLLLAISAIGLGLYRGYVKSTKQPAIRSLAVLPLENLSGDPSQEYLADGMTEELIGRLAAIHNLRVVSRTSVMQFQGTKRAVPEIAKELGVDAIVEGSVIRDGNRIRVHAQLIRAATDEHFWSETYDREMQDVLALESDVAESIAQKIDVTISGQERSRVVHARRVSPAAYEAYLKGRYYWNKRTAQGLQKGAFYFQQAIQEDPTYSAAYSGLADCNSGLAWHGFKSPAEALPKAYAAALKAIELDPQSAEAHASLGLVLNHRWEWDRAEAEFRRALELRPQYANAHHWYGDNLSIRARHAEALGEARKALELDPLNLMIGTWLGLRFYLAGQYDKAIEQTRATTDLDPTFAAAHLVLGESDMRDGQEQQGLSELETSVRLSGGSPVYAAQLGMANAFAGKKADALRIIAQLKRMSKERYVSPYGLAQIYAALDNKDQTFKWLDAAYDDRSVWMSYLAVDPVFNRCRSDQRFQKLLHRVGLAT